MTRCGTDVETKGLCKAKTKSFVNNKRNASEHLCVTGEQQKASNQSTSQQRYVHSVESGFIWSFFEEIFVHKRITALKREHAFEAKK